MVLDSISEQVVFLRSRGFLHNTLVHSQYIHNGTQWAIYNASVVYDPLNPLCIGK